jgi:dephospho-CoA kinase
MPTTGRVPFVGLTGGIGAGKTTALAALAELGAVTLSADDVVHELLASAEIRDAVVARMGADMLDGDGALDRSAVAERIFGRREDRAWIEGMLWPRVGARIVAWRDEVDALDPPPVAAVVEVPLLFEAGSEGMYDTTIAVLADEPLRAARAQARGHTAVAERATRQLSQREKAERAGYVVRNDGTREELKAALSRVLATITQ